MAMGIGEDKNITTEDGNSTEEKPSEPKTSERKIYRKWRIRKRRKVNDGGKL